jgi:NitT/TauT family transport system ATP-binding protein
MDEPFAALDCQTRNLMQEELLSIWEQDKKTILFVTHNVEEAVFLADRILVLTARPGRLYETIAVDIPRPRSRLSPELHHIRGHILHVLASLVSKEQLLRGVC